MFGFKCSHPGEMQPLPGMGNILSCPWLHTIAFVCISQRCAHPTHDWLSLYWTSAFQKYLSGLIWTSLHTSLHLTEPKWKFEYFASTFSFSFHSTSSLWRRMLVERSPPTVKFPPSCAEVMESPDCVWSLGTKNVGIASHTSPLCRSWLSASLDSLCVVCCFAPRLLP